ncbi:MAG: hypothetical protein HYR60_01635 [Acidobacteria bacterium]|nr:hypothetical protein [Acidobacteriota bacterium]
MHRRTFVAATVAAAAPPAAEGFRYRGYLGWITDLATQADTHATWPSMRLDEALVRDYRESFALMKQLGLRDLCVWGLYVSRAWPVDIAAAVPPARGRMVEKLIGAAHAQGVKVVSGLGVYSWGFEEILKAHPHLMKGNRSAMCGSEEESWEWMRKVIDFVFTRFPIDGVSMQSADQGRCTCARCSRFSETEYHARLNIRCADYIHSKWPGKRVAVSGWGMRFEDPASLPHLAELSRHIDYLIDVRDSSRRRDRRLRHKIIQSLSCAFGTLGGPQVEPPQHWPRDRWFLPTLRSAGEHLEELYRDGGRACEWFYHILANPGDELSTWVAAKVLADPATPWRKHLESSVEQIYRAPAGVRDDLCEAFLAAESAYLRHLPPDTCGTISLEPLVSSEPGPPVYLLKRLTPEQRAAYAADLKTVRARFEKLAPALRDPARDRIRFILRSIDNVRKDLTA